jgi:hypothetical protein
MSCSRSDVNEQTRISGLVLPDTRINGLPAFPIASRTEKDLPRCAFRDHKHLRIRNLRAWSSDAYGLTITTFYYFIPESRPFDDDPV